MKRLLILSLAILLSMIGCKVASTNPAPLAPGAYNPTDENIYRSLMAVQASLNNLKLTLVDPKTSPTTVSQLKPYLDRAVVDYDIAEVAWQAYYAALASNPNASPANVNAAIAKVQTDLQNTPKVNP